MKIPSSRNYFLLITGVLAIAFVSFQTSNENEPSSKAALGEKLFFDPILSANKTISCSSCHKPELAFADNQPFSLGVTGIPTSRNTPSVMNSASRLQFFWDGRAASLEEQALQPIMSPEEMNLPIGQAVQRLKENKEYLRWFKKIFRSEPSSQTLAEALAAFEKTLETANTPYDRYINGDNNAMNTQQIRGRLLFIGKANCANCHSGEDFTADRFKNIGLYNGKDLNDPGRFAITKDSSQLGHFKVPSLRNIALTAPYMHNGMFKTLRQVINYYNHPDDFIKGSIHRDLSLSTPLQLTEDEIEDLEAFLQALTDDRFTKKSNE